MRRIHRKLMLVAAAMLATGLLCARAVGGSTGKSFLNEYRMCAITAGSRGVRVGVVHAPTKVSFMMRVGQERSGLKLVEADYEAERALFSKGGQQGWLSMGKRDVTGQGPAMAARKASGDAAKVHRSKRKLELTKARNSRASARAKAQAARYAGLSEAGLVDAYHQEYQKGVIRSGGELGPPLPVPLTPETDAELVDEGHLPSQDERGQRREE